MIGAEETPLAQRLHSFRYHTHTRTCLSLSFQRINTFPQVRLRGHIVHHPLHWGVEGCLWQTHLEEEEAQRRPPSHDGGRAESERSVKTSSCRLC